MKFNPYSHQTIRRKYTVAASSHGCWGDGEKVEEGVEVEVSHVAPIGHDLAHPNHLR